MKSIIIFIFSSLSLALSPVLLAQSPESTNVVETNAVQVKSVQTKEDHYQGISITVNINTASQDELSTLLLGVGKKKAQRIIEYREQFGLFESLEDLMKVKGIGPSIVDKNRNRIQL